MNFAAGEEKNLHFQMDTSHLAPSKYRVDIIAYAYNEYGTQELIDGVFPGFFINIEQEKWKTNELIWMHQFWGHVRLHDVAVLGE